MTDPRALDEPLSDAELDELEVFLASDAVPQDCMDLEMLDGYLTAVVSGPEVIQPSEWLPQVWSEAARVPRRCSSTTTRHSDHGARAPPFRRHPAHAGRIPTRFRPLLYVPDEGAARRARAGRGDRVVRGYMAGVKIRDDEWQPLYDAQDARDWIFPIEALAFGDRDDDFTEWVDSDSAELIEELPVAAVLIFRFWLSRREATQGRGTGSRRSAFADATRKSRQRLH
jgi:uncharacterized protein